MNWGQLFAHACVISSPGPFEHHGLGHGSWLQVYPRGNHKLEFSNIQVEDI